MQDEMEAYWAAQERADNAVRSEIEKLLFLCPRPPSLAHLLDACEEHGFSDAAAHRLAERLSLPDEE